jgi:hypothetical protein
MPSRYDRAIAVTRQSTGLAFVPFAASLLSLSEIRQALATNGGGVTFPFPTGLPTLWTYVSLPGVVGTGPGAGPGSLALFVPLFLVGLLVTSALEAGLLGALDGRIDDTERGFAGGVEQFTLRMVGVNLVRAAVVLVALPFVVLGPLLVVGFLLVVVLSYLTYGLPFVVVVGDVGLGDALGRTIGLATDGGTYAQFGFAHLLAGAAASLVLSVLVRNGGIPGIVLGAAVVAVPAVFVATYGLFVFRDLEDGSPEDPDREFDAGHGVQS